MAGTTVKHRILAPRNSAQRAVMIAVNQLIDDVELLRAALVATCQKLDADAGVTDTNYAAQATVAAIDTAAELLAAKVANLAGTVVTTQ